MRQGFNLGTLGCKEKVGANQRKWYLKVSTEGGGQREDDGEGWGQFHTAPVSKAEVFKD